MKDIETREDIDKLMQAFYAKAMTDEEIGFYFTEVIPLNLEQHLPVIAGFWENVLFGTDSYQGNPMKVHEHIHHLSAFTEKHFNKWLYLFSTITDELFKGDNAELIKQRATSIATIMKIKFVYGGISK